MTPNSIGALLQRTRRVLAAAANAGISIERYAAVNIAAADPTSVDSLADANGDASQVPLICAAHPGCHLRSDGCVVPQGAEWEWYDDCGQSGSLADAVGVHASADDAWNVIDPEDWRVGHEEKGVGNLRDPPSRAVGRLCWRTEARQNDLHRTQDLGTGYHLVVWRSEV